MGRHNFWMSFQVACVYIGTVVGAGFASGREIYQFFIRFGNICYLLIFITTVLFAWLGYTLMALGQRFQAQSFRDANAYLFGKRVGHLIDTLFLLMMFAMMVAMLAGAGELFYERFGLPVYLGVLGTACISFVTLWFGISGIFKANSVIVPFMIFVLLYAAVHTFFHYGIHQAWVEGTKFHGNMLLAFISALVYISLNISLAAGVLVPMGHEIKDRSQLRTGAMMGAIGLGIMLFSVTITLLSYSPHVFDHALPMAFVATKLGQIIQVGFLFVLWGEIYSTLVGNVYSLTAQVAKKSRKISTIYVSLILICAILCSQIGFTNLVKYGYTLFGWVSLLFLLMLLWTQRGLRKT